MNDDVQKDEKQMISFLRPSGSKIRVEDTPNMRAYAKEHGWMTKQEAKEAARKS